MSTGLQRPPTSDGGANRSQAPVVGVILLVAVTVIIGAVLATFALSLLGDNPSEPEVAAFEWSDYPEKHGVLTWTHTQGDTLQVRNYIQKGAAVEIEFTDFTIAAGETSFVYARPGDTIYLVRHKRDSSQVIDKHEVPEDATLQGLDWSASDPNAIKGFRSHFFHHRPAAGGVKFDDQGGYVRIAAEQSGNSFLFHSRTVRENSGSITIDIEFRTDSFEDSGYLIYVRDKSGDTRRLWCDPSSGGGDFSLSCNSGAPTLSGSATKTVTMDEPIGGLFIVVDMENPGGGWDDEARFYDLKITPN